MEDQSASFVTNRVDHRGVETSHNFSPFRSNLPMELWIMMGNDMFFRCMIVGLPRSPYRLTAKHRHKIIF